MRTIAPRPASNRPSVLGWLTLPRLRRLSQVFWLSLLLFLVWGTGLPAFLQNLFLNADPFAAITNVLATGALYAWLLLSLVILIPTLFLGRFFCGWICPLGTLNHFAGNIKSGWKRGRRAIESNRYRPWQTLKYYLLIALLIAALFGSGIAGIMDPIALTVRSLALSIVPAFHYASHSALIFKQPYFHQAFLLGVLFITILALNLRITRLWCRALCPLGALLGACSRWSILGLEKKSVDCKDCNRCLLGCQGGDDPIPGAHWRKSECHLCMNCVSACPEGALRFRFFPGKSATVSRPNLGRRQTLTSLAAGAAILPLLRSSPGLAAERNARLLRPPGSLDEMDFLARCIRCSECMRVCPNNALQPSLTQAGIEGLWTPVLAPRIGYCEPSCTLCGQVCPTGSIWNFTAKEKAWVGAPANAKPIRLGTAFYDRGRCLPWSMATECIVCEEWCPISPKAIYLRAAEVMDSAGRTKVVRQPYADPDRCVGCGACEFACPVRDRPAVYVTSIGESRSKSNELLLRREAKSPKLLPETGEVAGWTKTRETRVFEASNLWQYVDGDAERYIQAGIRRTLTAEYRYLDQLDVVADVHVMSDPGGAKKIFESESASGSRAVPVGDAGRLYTQSLTFRKAAYFVRLVAYQETPQTEQAIVDLARAIDKLLLE